VPLGPKANRTRNLLLKAAHDLFCERGYQATSVAAIAKAAGVSLGAFYQYFRDRGDVLGTLVAEWVIAQLSDPSAPRWQGGRDGLHRSIHAFVTHYAETARFQAVWEEVTQIDPALAELRRQLSAVYLRIVEREIRLAREAGHIRTDLDAAQAARAVTAMIDRHCYVTYVFDPEGSGPPSAEETTELLTELVAGALRFESDEKGVGSRFSAGKRRRVRGEKRLPTPFRIRTAPGRRGRAPARGRRRSCRGGR
jgi:AcrR family transcriptional regulator